MNPMLQEALGSIIRWALMFVAGWLVQHGIWSASNAQTYVAGAAVAILTLGWSLWQKYQARIKLLAAMASAVPTTEAGLEQRLAMQSIVSPSVMTAKTTQGG